MSFTTGFGTAGTASTLVLEARLTRLVIRSFREGEYAQSKPDFLVHRPGDMDRNLACVEVKPSIRSVGDFRDDLKKLTWFCRNARYYGGIFLVYGVEEQETQELDRLRMKIGNAANDPDVDLGRISLLHHARVGEQARVVTL